MLKRVSEIKKKITDGAAKGAGISYDHPSRWPLLQIHACGTGLRILNYVFFMSATGVCFQLVYHCFII